MIFILFYGNYEHVNENGNRYVQMNNFIKTRKYIITTI